MCLAQPLRCASRPIRVPESLADPRFQGQWWILGLALTSMLFNYILGEGLRFDLKTKASPEQVLRALTDFTDRLAADLESHPRPEDLRAARQR